MGLGSSLVLGVLSAAAYGQAVEDPYAEGERVAADGVAGHDVVPDTDFTPRPKDGSRVWKQVGGARFADAGGADAERSVGITRYDDNLYSVSFRNARNGLVGGARCSDSNPDLDGESGCRPVLYRYQDDASKGSDPWSEVKLPGDGPGFIGAIAWIDDDRALVVGGTGTFPRREPDFGKDIADGSCAVPDAGEPFGAACDQAGEARAWLLREDGSWCELEHGRESDGCPALPLDRDGRALRGLTAVDFKPDNSPEIGFVGGLGQLARWQRRAGEEARFDKVYDARSGADEVGVDAATGNGGSASLRFRYRVRSIRFAPVPQVWAWAVTSGCCDEQGERAGLVMRYLEHASENSFVQRPGQWYMGTWTRQPLSVYSVSPSISNNPLAAPQSFLVASTARTRHPTEPRSRVGGDGRGVNGVGTDSVTETGGAVPGTVSASTVRLVSADGYGPWDSGNPNAYPDSPAFAVGEQRSQTAAGRGRRGVVNAPRNRFRTPAPTDLPPSIAADALAFAFPNLAPSSGMGKPETIAPEVNYLSDQLNGPHAPTDDGRLRSWLASFDYLVESYSLNALDVVGESGRAFAVGDHGGILALAADQTPEPDPPRLGTPERRPLSTREPYEGARPRPAGEPEAVPPLVSRPRVRLPRPRLVSMGSPDASHGPRLSSETEDVANIAMSRDGSEGWAVGPHPSPYGRIEASFSSAGYGGAVLYHYDGGSWRRCDPEGVPGELPPDPACASLGRLRAYKSNNSLDRVKLLSIARVPFENDGDEENDDDFEAVAIGTQYEGPEQPKTGVPDPVILRYRDGRWNFEERERRLVVTREGNGLDLKDVAFTAPDDGWILAGQFSERQHRLFHFDGREWVECSRRAGANQGSQSGGHACGSPRLPAGTTDGTRLRMTAAGDRVYLYGSRAASAGAGQGTERVTSQVLRPLIIYHERGGQWTDGNGAGEDGGGVDPACARVENGACQPAAEGMQGHVFGLAVAQRADGRYEGFAAGKFFRSNVPPDPHTSSRDGLSDNQQLVRPDAPLLRLAQDGERSRWELFEDSGALGDYVFPTGKPTDRVWTEGNLLAVSPRPGGAPPEAVVGMKRGHRVFGWSGGRGRFELPVAGLPETTGGGDGEALDPYVQAVAPDGAGGAWVSVKNQVPGSWSGGGQPYFLHYTDRPHREVFEEVSHPFGARNLQFTALAGARDGSVWLGSDTGTLARYDRLGGWETARIPGWDAGRLVTREAAVRTVAVNSAGIGVAAGEGGRIAAIEPGGVALDPAAGRRCGAVAEPCGTGRDLHASAVAEDGSALVGGEGMVMLWRPAGGAFRTIVSPPASAGSRVTGIAMPDPRRAWAVSTSGEVHAGVLTGSGWSWSVENVVGRGRVLGSGLALRAVAVDANGRGYAVGERGLVLYRDGDGARPWRRIRGPGTDDLTSVSLPRGGGENVVIGGRHGVVWTGEDDHLLVARPAEYFRGPQAKDDRAFFGPLSGPVVGFAVLPGLEPGQVEAWAAVQARGVATNRLLHYTNAESEPLLNPDRKAAALPDAPVRRQGEVSFAAFGKSDCPSGEGGEHCAEMLGGENREEVVSRRIAEEIADRRDEFALFTGDTSDSAGFPSNSTVPLDQSQPTLFGRNETMGRLKSRRWGEFVADPLEGAGVGVFGAIGPGDLSRPAYNPYGSESVTEPAKSGENLAWRQGMAARPAPWGKAPTRRAESESEDGLRFVPTPGSDSGSVRVDDVVVDGGNSTSAFARPELRTGARTHYSVEVERGGRRVARVVVVDTSLRSLAASDGAQHPAEPRGQLDWLERMLCHEGEIVAEGRCTRKPGQHAIVLSNTPTYTPGPGALDGTQHDAAAMERVLLRHRASVVVSGRLGWNGRYWATAPGLHEPCPGEPQRDTPPPPGTRACGRSVSDLPAAPGSDRLAAALHSAGPPPEPAGEARRVVEEAQGIATGLVPFVVASGAGGKFGPHGESQNEPASEGFWHGYTIVRLAPDGDPRAVVVEQRPVFDWINLTASEHVLRPGQKMRLRGVGREPIGFNRDQDSRMRETRFDAIDSPTITHRYDLLEADPDKPYLSRKDADGNPVPLSPDIATIDNQTGAVKAGRGNHPRAYAVAQLSVGEKAAVWPIVFEPRKSFRPEPAARIPAPPIPRQLPAIRTLAQSPSIPPQPPAAGVPPTNAAPTFPPTPALPAPPPPFSGTTPQPPAPPAPPPPPPPQLPTALDLLASPPSVPLAPQASVIPPPAPPIQPAPPGGARREARQRQAAVQKGEEGGSGESAEKHDVDMADGGQQPHGVSMTRRERDRPEPSFTTVARPDQPSAWARGALYGGGLTLAALLLSFTWLTGRPAPRRRPPDAAAPAWAPGRRPPAGS